MEVYINDMIVKSLLLNGHISDLQECFQNLRKNNMRLNLAKNIFGLGSGKFLSFLINQRRIEANPKKIQAVLNMHPPRRHKEVRKLAGCLAALR